MKLLHATWPVHAEYTLCGDAFDLCDAEGAPTPDFAQPGEQVTCEKCRIVISYCKEISRWRIPKATTPAAAPERNGGSHE